MTDPIQDTVNAVIEQLDVTQLAALSGGASFWETKTVPGVPSFAMSDGPHGLRKQEGDAADHLGLGASVPATCFPPAVSLGQSWDLELAERVGAALAAESQAQGVDVLLGPGINIKRDPRCGRNFEYLSEDPFLTGLLATAWVNGLQSGGVGASLKHFAANNAEFDRMRLSSDVDARPLHEIYLRAFETVIRDAQPWTVMCSYNRINGILASQNRWLLTDVLREQWGFAGAVISDWGAVADRVAAVDAGLDLQMPGDTAASDTAVVAAVEAGTLPVAAVERAARAVARTALLAQQSRREVTVDYDAHHALAREIAGRSIVLVKNDADLLPLDPSGRIAVIGPFATEPRYQGGGSSHVRPTRLDIPLDQIRAAAPGAQVTNSIGFTTDGDSDQTDLRAEAAELAAAADVAILFLGLAEHQESEGFDRDDIELPAAQLALLEAVSAVQPRTVVIISAGGVLRLAPVDEAAGAILSGGLLGQAGGSAIADVLFGTVNPSARLTETVPVRLQDAPSYLHFHGEHSRVRYGEGLFVGYRGYDARDVEVLYPFGHGLSYTTFSYEQLDVEHSENGLQVTVVVRNTGAVPGREIVQVYATKPDSAVIRPPQELVGVGTIDLKPGEAGAVHISVRRQDLAYWNDQLSRWVVEDGSYRIGVAKSSRDTQIVGEVTIVGDDVRTPFTADSTIGEVMAHPAAAAVAMAAFGSMMPQEGAGAELGMDVMKMMASMPLGRVIGGADEASAQHLQALLGGINAAVLA
ncbi:glycoside hydrolase family 3 C-terminal domain-containing protein [Microbacterium rhizomatis]|uniref:Exo-alpha-(1->6)-L-arabinopyranosidase n=1 Tax=Microbacterium rhizomatis TaxID=1631477 RepID=A0A5J5J0I1_9MICO|nr:glycoside hydrolase family 3 C-terminal domain-containing protein [Microbacterium rhizomatis]KAA9105869.1 beta-glucosidase [Microbacterium rhizomatis]